MRCWVIFFLCYLHSGVDQSHNYASRERPRKVHALHYATQDIEHLTMFDEDEGTSSEEAFSVVLTPDLATLNAPSEKDEPERGGEISASADSDVIGERGSDAPGSGYSDVNQWFMQDLLVHLTGLECNAGIVTKVDGNMLTVTFLGGETRVFSRQDLACRVAKANALRAPDEEDLHVIIAAAMEGGNPTARSTLKPRTTYLDFSPKSPVESVQVPRRRRARSDSTARNLDLKPNYEGLFDSKRRGRCVNKPG